MALLPIPDIFGHTIFCDDIRQEADGKLFFIGVYGSVMVVHAPFPVTLPTLAFGINLSQRKDIFLPRAGLRIFLPGDAESAASIQAEIGEISEGVVAAQLSAMSESIHPDARVPIEESYPSLRAILKFTQIELKQPGRIKVRAIVGENIARIGSIAVSLAPQQAVPNT
jgi:hypothetical protein